MKTNFLKITGSAAIESVLENDQDYELVANISIYSAGEERSQQNGDYEVFHKAKINGAVTLIKGQESIRGIDCRKESQKTRFAINALRDELELNEVDEEVFYNAMQGVFRRHLSEVFEKYKSELNIL